MFDRKWCLLFLWLGVRPAIAEEPVQFEVTLPAAVLREIPVPTITIEARNEEGEKVDSFHGKVSLQGIEIRSRGELVSPPPFSDGTLSLKSDLSADYRVFVTEKEIVVSTAEGKPTLKPVPLTSGWLSLVPPLLAVILAVALRQVVIALVIGIYSGVLVINEFAIVSSIADSFRSLFLEIWQPGTDHSHLMIIFFTLFLGAMIGVMGRSGGTQALVDSLSRYTTKREHAQLLTSGLGVVVFFDDYANTLMVGSTMRPVSDRLKISREKLAFLVDATAAPVAGLAVISTWVGVEIGYISDTYDKLGMGSEVYDVFLATLPYRFYPVLLLCFVWMIAATGRDFGPMRQAELKVQTDPPSPAEEILPAEPDRKGYLRLSLIPLVVLLLLILGGLYYTGQKELTKANEVAAVEGKPVTEWSLWSVLDKSSPNIVLLLSSFLAALTAVAFALQTKSLSPKDCVKAWLTGMKDMSPAIVILVLAWVVATLCDDSHLNTAGYLVNLTSEWLSVQWLPSIVFLLSGAVAFSTGSSWSTMGLIMPLAISLCFYLLREQYEPAAIEHHGIMLGTIGAVLAGAIFGDHCSPISDTTILSSAASGCDHLSHVATQMPYALVVGMVSLLLGYVPVGLGLSAWWILLPSGIGVLFLIVKTCGKRLDHSPPSP